MTICDNDRHGEIVHNERLGCPACRALDALELERDNLEEDLSNAKE